MLKYILIASMVLSSYLSSCQDDKDKLLPDFHLCTILGPEHPEDSLLGEGSYLWKKKIVSVYFMDDDGSIRNQTLQTANEWSTFSGITFVRALSKGNSDIRVSYRTNGWWSHVGSYALSLGKDSVTLSLDSIYLYDASRTKSVILHEFGHALGLLHEHQHKGLNIPWDSTALYKYYKENFNLDSDWVNENVITKYKSPTAIYCEPDPASIMIYEIPAKVTKNGSFHVDEPLELSPLDKKYINYMYTGKDCKLYQYH